MKYQATGEGTRMAEKSGQEDKNARRSGGLLGTAWVYVAIAAAEVVLFLLVFGLIWYLSPIFSAERSLSISQRKNLVEGLASVVQAVAVLVAGVVGLTGLYFTRQTLLNNQNAQILNRENTQRTLELSEQGQITDRFTRAIDQLGATDDDGNPRLEVRLGGIYALERIDKESPERVYHAMVMEVLTAYVRENAPWPPKTSRLPKGGPIMQSGSAVQDSASKESTEVSTGSEQGSQRRRSTDIQAILEVLKRREEEYIPEKHRVFLDLRGTDLRGANLYKADLQGALLDGANLWGARLDESRLQGAVFRGANLQEAVLDGAQLQGVTDLHKAHLDGAFLRRANLRGVFLGKAHLEGARLNGIHLEKVILGEAYLQGASLRGAHLAGTILGGAYLEGAHLNGAHLEKAILGGAHLEEARLNGAYLEGARLNEARLRGALLDGANLQGTDLEKAMGLIPEQIRWTIGDEKTELPEYLVDHRPSAWSKSPEEQERIVQERPKRLEQTDGE
jgi:uncharacterized protein YjbI with pentapeptide repeats